MLKGDSMKRLLFSLLLITISLSATTINVPGDQGTIQAGINAAVDGDTVLIANGTYMENVVVEKQLTIMSENGADNTVINGNGLIGLDILGGNPGGVHGITFTNADQGLRVSYSDSYYVTNCIFTDNNYGLLSHGTTAIIVAYSLFSGNQVGYLETYYGFDCAIINSTFDNVRDIWFEPSYGSTVKLDVSNSIFRGQVDGYATNPVNFYYCTYVPENLGVNVSLMTSNISEDPLFVNPSADDYSLQSTSPCIDAGDPVSFSNDIDGSRNDIGYSGGSGLILGRSDISFGNIGSEEVAEESVSISNYSDNTVTINTYSSDNSQFFSGIDLPLALSPGQTGNISFLCDPNTFGDLYSTITLDVNGLFGATEAQFTCSGYVIDNSTQTLRVPEAAPTMQSAVDVAADGDTILVAAGTYHESILVNKQLAFVSVSGPENTIIDGDGLHGIEVLSGNPGSTEGFTFINCNVGLQLNDCVNYSVNDCWYINNNQGLNSHQNTILQVSYCLFQDNDYGFVDGYYGQSSDIVNCTFDNTINDILFQPSYGTTAELSVINSIFMGQIDGYDTNPVNLSYCSFQASNLGLNVNNIIGNISGDPLFTDPENGDYNLQPGSPCIDVGDPSSPRDQDGSRVDMGAFPSNFGIPLAVTLTVPDEYSTIQDAINASRSGDTVLVSQGTYIENLSIEGKAITLGSLFLTTQDTSYISSTIIDGNQTGSVFSILNGGDGQTSLIGLTLQNGSGTGDDFYLPWTGGGGIFTKDANITLDYCVIKDCQVPYRYGGGVLFYPSAYSFSMNNSTVTNCSGPEAGGALALFSGDFSLQNNEFTDCSTSYSGGAIYVGGTFEMINCRLIANSSNVGGALSTDGGTLLIKKSLFTNNVGGNGGGAIWSGHSADMVIDKSTIVNNDGVTRGGAIIKSQSGPLSVTNSIIKDNSDQYLSQIFIETGVPLDVLNFDYNNISTDTTAVYFVDDVDFILENSNVDLDSRFVDAENNDYRLLAASFLINSGHPDSTDSDGTRADMGAYPYLNSFSGPDWHVSVDGDDIAGTGELSNPFASIQAGINFSANGDSVTVDAGTYFENINFRGRNIKVFGEQGPENTIIDGGQSGSVVTFNNGENENSELTGFTISNGLGEGDWPFYHGGGLTCISSSPTILDLIVDGNTAVYAGGGIYIGSNSNVFLEDIIVRNNLSPDGAGICFSNSSGSIYNSQIISNTSTYKGGGIILAGSSPQISNTLIANNTAPTGSALSMYFCESLILNSTIAGNQSIAGGAAIYIKDSNGPSFINSILWNEDQDEILFAGLDWASSVYVKHSNVDGGIDAISTSNPELTTVSWLEGNITSDPRFNDPDGQSYSLTDYSPCIGAGLDTTIVPSSDIEGSPRPNPAGSNPDIGAFESPLAEPVVIVEIQNLNIGEDEDTDHLVSHNPLISFTYYNSLEAPLTYYQIQVSSTPNFVAIDKWDTYTVIGSDTIVAYGGNSLVDGVDYYLRVKGSSGEIWSDWTTLAFRMNSIPTSPILLSPIENTVIGDEAVFSLQNSSDSELDELLYQFYLYEDVAMSTLVDSSELLSEGVETTSWISTIELADNNQYWWTARVYDGYEFSSLTSPASFLVNTDNAPPDPFELIYPLNDIELGSLTPTFSWHTAVDIDPDDAVSYELYLDTPEPGVEVYELGGDTLFQPPTPLSDNTSYYWRVVARDLSGFETNSMGEYRKFTVNLFNDNPSVVDLITPDSVMVLTLTPQMIWSPATDIDPGDMVTYEMHWWADGIELDSVLTDTNAVTLPRELADNTQYLWEVIAMDQTDGISHSGTATFWTDLIPEAPEDFALLSPENDAAGLSNMPSFQWEIAKDPDPMDYATYTLQIATDSSFSDVVFETNTNVEAGLELTESLSTDTEYWWRVVATDADSLTTESEVFKFTVGYVSIAEEIALPTEYVLDQNYPNPFNPSTTIRYGLPEETNVSLVIYDVRGQVVQTIEAGHQSAGWYDVIWNGETSDGKTISTGIYFARLVAGDYSHVIKMLFLK